MRSTALLIRDWFLIVDVEFFNRIYKRDACVWVGLLLDVFNFTDIGGVNITDLLYAMFEIVLVNYQVVVHASVDVPRTKHIMSTFIKQ